MSLRYRRICIAVRLDVAMAYLSRAQKILQLSYKLSNQSEHPSNQSNDRSREGLTAKRGLAFPAKYEEQVEAKKPRLMNDLQQGLPAS